VPRTVYTILYMDPATGFLKREEFDTHRAQETRITELVKRGVTRIQRGHFERE